MNNSIKTRRLFFALWPSDRTRQAIIESFDSLSLRGKGRATLSGNLHITLHFVGTVTDEIKECMHLAAQSISSESFILTLNCFGYFPRAKVFWMGSLENPAGITQLYDKLGAAIAACGYHFEARVYAPHVTLMRKCSRPELKPTDFSIPWSVDEFVLVESTTTESGAIYRVIEKYGLLKK